MLILMPEKEQRNQCNHLWWWIHSCSSKTCKEETKEVWDKCQCNHHSWTKWTQCSIWEDKETQWWEDKIWDITTIWEEIDVSTINIIITTEEETSTETINTITIIIKEEDQCKEVNKDNKDNLINKVMPWTITIITCKDKITSHHNKHQHNKDQHHWTQEVWKWTWPISWKWIEKSKELCSENFCSHKLRKLPKTRPSLQRLLVCWSISKFSMSVISWNSWIVKNN